MLTIPFESMKLLENNCTVRILGTCFGQQIIIELSILQLAKIFGTDRYVAQEVDRAFGSEEFEKQCNETRECVKTFPEIKVWDKEMEFGFVTVKDPLDISECKHYDEDHKTWENLSENIPPTCLSVYAEDIVGWNNEGIRITIPRDIFDRQIDGRPFRLFASPFCVELRLAEEASHGGKRNLV